MTATKTAERIRRLRALAEHPNTPEHERAVAAHMLNKLLAKEKIDRRWYGAKYDKTGTLTTVDIAALIRAEIKIARKLGKQTADLPDDANAKVLAVTDPIPDMPAQIKIGIRVPYAGCIRMRLTNIPLDWGFVPAQNPSKYRRYDSSPALVALVEALHVVMDAYDHNGSELESDYFDHRFYGSVETEHPEDVHAR